MWKIVIVDDERQVLQGMKRIIPWRELGAELAGEASDGEQGVRIVLESQPDIVITDIYMPVMSGLDMMEELRNRQYDGTFIILSGYSDFEYARRALRLNVQDYLSKPATVQTIKDVLSKAIEAVRAKQAAEQQADEWQRRIGQLEPLAERERLKAIVTGAGDAGQNGDEERSDPQRQYRVLALEFTRHEHEEQFRAGDWQLFRYAVGNMCRELGEQAGMKLDVVELHGSQMAVLLRERVTADRDAAVELARRLHVAANDYLHLHLQAGVGTAKPETRQIPDSTDEAFQALHAKRCVPVAQYPVFIYKQREDSGVWWGPGMLRLYQQLAESVRSLDRDKAETALDGITNHLQALPDVAAADLQRLANECWTVIRFSLLESGISADEEYSQERFQQELQRMILPQHFCRWLEERICDVNSRFGRSDKVKHRQSVDFIIRYVNEHYAEDLRLSDLAEKVFISRNHLSGIFREATGETFNDYVTRVRIERAKALLLEGKLMVYEVAERVGYKNVPYFTTLFKRHTGRIPTDFGK